MTDVQKEPHNGKISIEEASEMAAELGKVAYMAGMTAEELAAVSPRIAKVLREIGPDCQNSAKSSRAEKRRKRRNGQMGTRARGCLHRLFPKNR